MTEVEPAPTQVGGWRSTCWPRYCFSYDGRRGSLRQVYVMPALRKPEGRSGKGRAGQGPIMGHYRTGRNARPGTEWGAPAPDLPAGLPQISATLPAACRWLPGATAGRQRAARTTSGGRWAAGRGSWVVGRVVGRKGRWRSAACRSSCKRCDRRAPRAWRRGWEGVGVRKIVRRSSLGAEGIKLL